MAALYFGEKEGQMYQASSIIIYVRLEFNLLDEWISEMRERGKTCNDLSLFECCRF